MKRLVIPIFLFLFLVSAVQYDMKAGQYLSKCERDELIGSLCHLLFKKKNTHGDEDRLRYLSKKVQADIRFLKCTKVTWDELRKTIINKPRGKRKFTAFGYGSLINPKRNLELVHTKDYIPALLIGYKRVFHLDHPSPETSSVGLPAVEHPKETARLDIFPTHNSSDIVNGVLFEIDLRDFERFKARESVYDIHECLVINYAEAMDPNNRFPTFESAYVLSLPEDHPTRNPNVLPHIVYLYNYLKGGEYWEHQETTMEGEDKPLYPGYVDLLAETTYLSDQRTTLYQWIKRQGACKNILFPQSKKNPARCR